MAIRRVYSGGASSTTTSASIAASGTASFTIVSDTGWPFGTDPFYVVVEPGTANEEKMLVVRASGSTTLTMYTGDSGRGLDDTVAVSHSSGSTIYPVFTAVDADEANEFVATMTAKGDLISLNAAAGPVKLGVGSDGLVLTADSAETSGLSWDQVGTAGIADGAVTTAKIAAGSVDTAELAAGAVTAAKMTDGAGSGVDADLLDGQEGSYYQAASTALTTSTSFSGDVSGNYNSMVVANDSHTHDTRYFTETQADNRFVRKDTTTDQTMSGRLIINRNVSGSSSSGAVLVLGSGGNSQTNLYFNTSANDVQIRTDNASSTFYFRNGADSAYVPLRASAFTVSSSERFKHNIADFSGTIHGLLPKSFDLIEEPNQGRQHGFIAEQVAEHLPEAVNHNADGQPESLNLMTLLAAAVNTINQLEERIAALEATA